jgi:hypothetical protein
LNYNVRRKYPTLVLTAALLAAQAQVLFAATVSSFPAGVIQGTSVAGPAASVAHSIVTAMASGSSAIGQLKPTLSSIAGAPSVVESAPRLAALQAAPQAAAMPQLEMPVAPVVSEVRPDEPAAGFASADRVPGREASPEAQPNAASAAHRQAPALAGGLLERLPKVGDAPTEMWDGSAKKGSEDETAADHERTDASADAHADAKTQKMGHRGHSHQKLKMPYVEGHPNRLPFEGTMSLIDIPSDKAPSGARGHRVTLTMKAAREALPSLLGMAVDYRPGWDGHDAQRKIGLLTEAQIIGKRLVVRGFLYAKDFPEVVKMIKERPTEEMGMSYELASAKVENLCADVWKLGRVTFTGAAILLREKAAYTSTAFRLTEPAAAPAGEQAKAGS